MMEKTIIKIVGTSLNVVSYFTRSYAGEKALRLFGTPRRGGINERQSDFLATSYREEFLYEDTSIMTYRWLGEKGTILLAHGWESNSARWRRLIEYLQSKDYEIIAIDAPAHGNSGGKLFNAIQYSEFINVIAKHFDPNIIIGHSVGGMASVFFQYKYQMECVKKLILLGAPDEFADVLKRYEDMLGYNQRVSRQINATIIERYGQAPESFSTAKYSEQLNSKALIIHDKHDKIIPYADALKIKNSFNNSRLITTTGLGHSLNDESIADHIYEFLES